MHFLRCLESYLFICYFGVAPKVAREHSTCTSACILDTWPEVDAASVKPIITLFRWYYRFLRKRLAKCLWPICEKKVWGRWAGIHRRNGCCWLSTTFYWANHSTCRGQSCFRADRLPFTATVFHSPGSRANQSTRGGQLCFRENRLPFTATNVKLLKGGYNFHWKRRKVYKSYGLRIDTEKKASKSCRYWKTTTHFGWSFKLSRGSAASLDWFNISVNGLNLGVTSYRLGKCCPQKDCLRWHWLTLQQPEWKPSSESSELWIVSRCYKSHQRELSESTKGDIRRVAFNIQSASLPDSNLTKAERQALKWLKTDKDIVILPADKGRVDVVMDKTDYYDKKDALVNNKKTYGVL